MNVFDQEILTIYENEKLIVQTVVSFHEYGRPDRYRVELFSPKTTWKVAVSCEELSEANALAAILSRADLTEENSGELFDHFCSMSISHAELLR